MEELLDPADVVFAGFEVVVVEDAVLEGNGGFDAFDLEFQQGALHAGYGDLPGVAGIERSDGRSYCIIPSRVAGVEMDKIGLAIKIRNTILAGAILG